MKNIIFFISLFLLSLAFYNINFAQNINFEVCIEDDSLDITPVEFLFEPEISKYVGIVHKRNLFPDNKTSSISKPYIYTIDCDFGDTISYDFSKEDSTVLYYNFTPVNIGESGYILSGVCKSDVNNDGYKTIFTRINNNYEIIWERIMRLENNFNLLSMRTIQLKDSSFLYVWSPESAGKLIFQKISYYGDSLLFRKVLGDTAGDIWSLTYNHDSTGYIVHNRWGFYETGTSSCSMIEFNENLVYRRHKFYEEYVVPELSAKLLPNGNLLASGHIYRVIHDETVEEYIGVYIYDKNLNLLYKRELTDPEIGCKPGAYAIDYSCPSCIYVAGTDNFQSFGGNEPDWYYLAKLNDTLGIEFEKYIGGDNYYWLRSVTSSDNGTVLLGGYKTEVGGPWFYNDAYFVELDSLGCITGSNINSKDIIIKDLIVYPNPGSNVLNIRTALKECEFHLFDIWGMPIATQAISGHITSIKTNYLPKGNYYYSVTKNKKIIISGSWIKN